MPNYQVEEESIVVSSTEEKPVEETQGFCTNETGEAAVKRLHQRLRNLVAFQKPKKSRVENGT